MKKEDLDYDILKSFLSDEDQKNFIVFENVIMPSPFHNSIHLVYRCPFNKSKVIQISEYLQRVRDKKLEQILQ